MDQYEVRCAVRPDDNEPIEGVDSVFSGNLRDCLEEADRINFESGEVMAAWVFYPPNGDIIWPQHRPDWSKDDASEAKPVHS